MAKGLGYWYIELEKQGFWRGAPHTFVNRYVMSGADPSAANAGTVIGVLKGIEDKIFPTYRAAAGVGFVEGRAYGAAGGSPFEVITYNPGGVAATATGYTGGTGSIDFAPTLEVCLGVTTKLNGLSSNGKPLYLRKFFRGIYAGPEEDFQNAGIDAATITAVNELCAPWQTGMGPNNWVVIGTSGKQASAAPQCEPYLVNRQVPKGRKKKKATADSLLSAIESFTKLGSAASALGGLAADVGA